MNRVEEGEQCLSDGDTNLSDVSNSGGGEQYLYLSPEVMATETGVRVPRFRVLPPLVQIAQKGKALWNWA